MNNYKFLSLLILSMFIIACSGTPIKTYTGPTLKHDDVAIVTTNSEFMELFKPFQESGHVRLISIDGQMGEYGEVFGYHSRLSDTLNISLLPGNHSLSTKYFGQTGTTIFNSPYPVTFSFVAEKGHKYLLSYKRTDSSWNPVLTDITVKKQVFPQITN